MFGWNIISIHSDQYDYSTLNSIIILQPMTLTLVSSLLLSKLTLNLVDILGVLFGFRHHMLWNKKTIHPKLSTRDISPEINEDYTHYIYRKY